MHFSELAIERYISLIAEIYRVWSATTSILGRRTQSQISETLPRYVDELECRVIGLS